MVRIATAEVHRSPGRTAYTVGAVLLALSSVLSIRIGMGSFSRVFRGAFDDFIRADLYARSDAARALGTDVPVDVAIADELRMVPGVHSAYPFRLTQTTVDGRPLQVIAFDMAAYADIPRLPARLRERSLRDASLLASPATALMSASMASRLGSRVGDRVRVPSPGGPVAVRIAGSLGDPAALVPTLYMDFAEFSRIWRTSTADSFQIALRHDADVARVRAEVSRVVADRGLAVYSRAEYIELANGRVTSLVDVVNSIVVVIVLTAGVAMANTLLISTVARRREIGVLRAIGMRRAQVRRMVAAEALVLSMLAVGGACLIGTALGYAFTMSIESALGVPVPNVLRLDPYAQTALIGIVGATAAALYPAARAARTDVVSALHHE